MVRKPVNSVFLSPFPVMNMGCACFEPVTDRQLLEIIEEYLEYQGSGCDFRMNSHGQSVVEHF